MADAAGGGGGGELLILPIMIHDVFHHTVVPYNQYAGPDSERLDDQREVGGVQTTIFIV